MKRSYSYYNELRDLSYYVYHNKDYKLLEGWTSIQSYNNPKTGFYGEAFQNKQGEVFTVYRATEIDLRHPSISKKDLYADYQLAINKLPEQYNDAMYFYNQVQKKYPNQKIKQDGYSLGGSLATLVGAQTGAETVTFEAYGNNIIKAPKYTDNIINFGNEDDPIFIKGLDNLIGKTYIIPNSKDIPVGSEYGYDSSGENGQALNIFKHFPGNNGDLSTAIPYNKYKFDLAAEYNQKYDKGNIFDRIMNEFRSDKNNSGRISEPTGFASDVNASSSDENSPKYMDKNGNKIYTREDLHNMSKEEENANHDAIMKQASRGMNVA